ncbi:hypothetical protein AB0758_08515 [Tolypothrix bouteillei VB521301_2]|uniref:Uncharacterized protein n=2 Tax=Tolypothrix TaxID=111782 RepID=A0A0C1N7E2_9CYAN|nr:hypothetical protein DA73_0400014265 [Tolypothrix bouteillei VB521301]
MLYRWTEISKVPQKPGVYAWYYSPEITDYDLSKAIDDIKKMKQLGEVNLASEVVEKFLYNSIFQYFREEPYQAFLRGPLKPKYQGCLEHKPILSETLVSRIIEEPERLITVKDVVEKSAPNFASPIYIGMAERLGVRLKQHKKLIEKYRSQVEVSEINQNSFSTEDTEKSDNSFALQICRRNITPSRLFVVINILGDLKKKYVDIENILNRIHYPLLGRN